jgi:hypothetical protein
MKPLLPVFILVGGLLGAPALLNSFAAEETIQPDKPKSISDVMVSTHKGRESLVNRVRNGNGTTADIDLLLLQYKFIAKQEPPMGDKDEWIKKTKALVDTTTALKLNREAALEKFKEASNCKACHDVHRSDD